MNQPQSVLQAIFGGLGATELILILLIVLLVFGAGKLPQIGEALGKSIKNFKSATNKGKEEVEVTPKAIEDKDKSARTVDVEAPSEKKNA
jgi:sec-independent protein translocase protein TatA